MSSVHREKNASVCNLFEISKFDDLKLKLGDDIFENLHWEYRGEGNENLVLYFPQIKFVLRLRKNHANDQINSSYEKEKLKMSLLYYYILLEPFLSERYLTLPVIAEISDTAVEYLDRKLFSERPGHRKNKRILFNGVEIHPDYTFLSLYAKYQQLTSRPCVIQAPESDSLRKSFPREYLDFRNYVFSLLTNQIFSSEVGNLMKSSDNPTFCIEIKPKQAWTAEPYRRFDTCAFCMNQYFKLHEGKIKNRSQYCPLDFFSGIESRMKKSLEGLLQTPQNNFKIFQNGKIVFDENSPNNVNYILTEWFSKSQNEDDIEWSKNHFFNLMMNILKKDFLLNQKSTCFKIESYSKVSDYKLCSDEETELIRKAFYNSRIGCDFNFADQPKNCILNRIIELQKLDVVGLETVLDFYENCMKENATEFSYLVDLISRVKFQSGDVEMPILNVAEAYTLSTAAKDLSIMITIRNISSDYESEFIVEVDDLMYEVNVSLVDVGPKPISCIKKHWKRDRKILIACLNYFYPNLAV